jgi:hypothetical protein
MFFHQSPAHLFTVHKPQPCLSQLSLFQPMAVLNLAHLSPANLSPCHTIRSHLIPGHLSPAQSISVHPSPSQSSHYHPSQYQPSQSPSSQAQPSSANLSACQTIPSHAILGHFSPLFFIRIRYKDAQSGCPSRQFAIHS